MSRHPITVTPSKDANGVVQWTLSYGNRSGHRKGEYPRVDLRRGGTNERFEITLVDTQYGITFSDDPLWIQVGECPTQPGIDNSLIDDIECGPTLVKFRDLNSNKTELTLSYRLNFNVPDVRPGEPGTFLDPEIRNGGGGGAGASGWLALVATGAVALVAYVAYEAFVAR